MANDRLIYALCCPFTKEIHYIGKTTKGMSRPLMHSTNSHSKKIKEWVSNIKELGYKPKIIILEEISKDDNIDDRERYWIKYRLSKGDKLFNDMLMTPLIISEKFNNILNDYKDETSKILHISKFSKERRKTIGISQIEFSEKSGVSLKVVRKLEQGKSNIMLDSLLSILKMYGCTLDVVKINDIK